MRLTGFFIILLLSVSVHAEILFDDGVPARIIQDIERAPDERKPDDTYLIEMQNEEYLLIISGTGIIRRVEAAKITGMDILNIIEIMDQQIDRLAEENGTPPPPGTYTLPSRTGGKRDEEPADDVEKKESFFSFADPDNRLFVGVSVFNEERFTAEMSVSIGLEFFRFGMSAKKGLNIAFEGGVDPLPWQAFGLYAEMSLVNMWKMSLATGIEGNFYNILDRSYIRENIYTVLYLKWNMFVPALEFHISPTKLRLQKESETYETSQFYFGISLYFAF